MITITALHIYPVKSCRGVALERAQLTQEGFMYDREWMIVRPDGRFVTQREEPRLALIEPSVVGDSLQLRAPRMDALTIARGAAEKEVEVTCWRDSCAAFDAGEDAAHWLERYLGAAYRLVRFDPRRPRPSNPDRTQGIEAHNRFTDGYPWLLISQASLQDLNARLEAPLPMNRFRPNIVVDGLPPFGEDTVREFVADGVRLRAVKPCTRCVITTTDQATGERHEAEPLRTLRSYRFSREHKGVLFGQNLIVVEGIGRELAVGQPFSLE